MTERINITTEEYELLEKIKNADDREAVKQLSDYYRSRGESVNEEFIAFLKEEGLEDSSEGLHFRRLFEERRILDSRNTFVIDDPSEYSITDPSPYDKNVEWSDGVNGPSKVTLDASYLLAALTSESERTDLLTTLFSHRVNESADFKVILTASKNASSLWQTWGAPLTPSYRFNLNKLNELHTLLLFFNKTYGNLIDAAAHREENKITEE